MIKASNPLPLLPPPTPYSPHPQIVEYFSDLATNLKAFSFCLSVVPVSHTAF